MPRSAVMETRRIGARAPKSTAETFSLCSTPSYSTLLQSIEEESLDRTPTPVPRATRRSAGFSEQHSLQGQEPVSDGRKRILTQTPHVKMCQNCGATSTPSWRRCQEGRDLLCNACGLYQKLHQKSRPFVIATDGSVKVQRQGAVESLRCSNCGTEETPLWRRGVAQECLCNACGLYLKQHQRYRAIKGGKSTFSSTIITPDYNSPSQAVKHRRSHTPCTAPAEPAISQDQFTGLDHLAQELCSDPIVFDPTDFSVSNDSELLQKLQNLQNTASLLLTACEQQQSTNKTNV